MWAFPHLTWTLCVSLARWCWAFKLLVADTAKFKQDGAIRHIFFDISRDEIAGLH
jgi:hypothetical protein